MKAKQIWIDGMNKSLQPDFYIACLLHAGFIDVNKIDKTKAENTPLLIAALEEKGIKTAFSDSEEVIKAKRALKFLLD